VALNGLSISVRAVAITASPVTCHLIEDGSACILLNIEAIESLYCRENEDVRFCELAANIAGLPLTGTSSYDRLPLPTGISFAATA
jgi:hypothetical protein